MSAVKIRITGPKKGPKIYSIEAGPENLMKDRKLIQIISEGMDGCRDIVAAFLYNEPGIHFEKWCRERNAWVLAGLKNPMVPDEIKTMLKKIDTIIPPKKFEFLSYLTEEVAGIYSRLIDVHEMDKNDARQLVLTMLDDCFPNHKKIETITDEAFKKSLDKYRKLHS